MRQPETPSFPGPKPVLVQGTLQRIFSGLVGLGNFWVGLDWGIFLPGYEIFFWDFRDKLLRLNEKYAFHSQTEQEE